MTTARSKTVDELPADNAARVALYDALVNAVQTARAAKVTTVVSTNLDRSSDAEHPMRMPADAGRVESASTTPVDAPESNAVPASLDEATRAYDSVAADDVFSEVIGRLRVLVPRELHVQGERAYFEEKLQACVEAGIIAMHSRGGLRMLTLTGHPPQVRFPSGEVRDYPAGLEFARERLDRDNKLLRAAEFDVRKYVPSIADDPKSEPFQALLASMRELGFLPQFGVVKYADGAVVDGLARCRAAEILGLAVEEVVYASPEKRKVAVRRDSGLNRVLVALHSNAARIAPEVVADVHERVSAITQRPWQHTAADLAATWQWRYDSSTGYTPVFDVKQLAYRPGDDPKIQVDSEGRVMLRSIVRAAGLADYQVNDLGPYVPFERGRTAHSGRSAFFARAEDMVRGIAAMQTERQASKKLKVYPEWDQIRDWLIATLVPSAR